MTEMRYASTGAGIVQKRPDAVFNDSLIVKLSYEDKQIYRIGSTSLMSTTSLNSHFRISLLQQISMIGDMDTIIS